MAMLNYRTKWLSWLFQLAIRSWVESQVSHDFIPTGLMFEKSLCLLMK